MYIKMEIVHSLTDLGFNVLYTDSDIFFKKNVLNEMSRYIESNPTAEIIAQNDSYQGDQVTSNLCAGFFFARSSPIFVKLTHPNLYDYSMSSDQEFFNVHVCPKLKCVALPQQEFANGYVLYNRKVEPSSCTILHFNYIVGHEKKSKMIDFNAWII